MISDRKINMAHVLANGLCRELRSGYNGTKITHRACAQYAKCEDGCILNDPSSLTIKDLQRFINDNSIEFNIKQ